ncbi:precorrin-3B C(17)-methyltransferase [Pseudomonas cavernicola]|uniref:Precorrin-3B C(17)-methyltransferase n=1 Tax=Pseudomonas cavernicola TaxID=2320866 RepID=A0A418XJW4_9PSED|nr:precorrin-3B C(17)-methyltransferase [Pseudomonas cavernicola]RJG12747.1 precorrin-3B C(17)-methyltransferase [Pseudomonas cavernicola]
MSNPQANTPAIVILGMGALATARRVQALYPGAQVHGLEGRVEADILYSDFGGHLRELYQRDTPIIALCAAGIIIRTLAPLLAAKNTEPPVLAVAEDGSVVVPLLGGLGGVNMLAREIAAALEVVPAITTSGELRFGTCVLNPPTGYVLADIEQGKRFVSNLLGGQSVRIEGAAPWLDQARLPLAADAALSIRITHDAREANGDELLIHPRTVVAVIDEPVAELAANVQQALAEANIAAHALVCLVASSQQMANPVLQQAALTLGVPLRFIAADNTWALAQQAIAEPQALHTAHGVTLAVASEPLDHRQIGQARGRLTVVGLGPGAAEFMVPAAKLALQQAEDVLGYETYVKMAGPFRPEQVLHCSDNREELQRARHAFELASSGRSVVVVSSGDPGVFAMAAAVLEALEASSDPLWHAVDLQIFPGVSAALATAARAGAPLGHDFCIMSLSDNLKPWDIIELRLEHAAAADLALAFYNPISRARPWQLGRALEIVAGHRSGDTIVVLGRDIGRPGETLTLTTLAELRPEQVDMRTMVIIGSSTTRRFARQDGGAWVYTPRSYP